MDGEEVVYTGASLLLLAGTLALVVSGNDYSQKADSTKAKREIAEARVNDLKKRKASIDDAIEKASKEVKPPKIKVSLKPDSSGSKPSDKSPAKPSKSYSDSKCQGVKGLDTLNKLSPDKLYQLARGYFYGSSKFPGCPQDYGVAARLFAKYAQRFPKYKQAPYALYNVGFSHFKAKRYCEAQKAFQLLHKKYSSHPASKWTTKPKLAKKRCKR